MHIEISLIFKIWHKRTYLWNRNRITDIEKKLVVAKGAGVGGRMKWEGGISRCKLLYIGWINNKVLLHSTQNCIQYPMIKHHGKEYCKRYICIHIIITYTTEYLLGFKSLRVCGGGQGELSILIHGAVVSRGCGQHLLILLSFLFTSWWERWKPWRETHCRVGRLRAAALSQREQICRTWKYLAECRQEGTQESKPLKLLSNFRAHPPGFIGVNLTLNRAP